MSVENPFRFLDRPVSFFGISYVTLGSIIGIFFTGMAFDSFSLMTVTTISSLALSRLAKRLPPFGIMRKICNTFPLRIPKTDFFVPPHKKTLVS
ncbi:MAG: hypothetical protein OXF02_02695 [Simkaniaceae bacterium]|nr:hypothetical protein [Simkaniaceae bacterium]